MAGLLPRVKVRSFLEDFSDIDPSKFHFYDFGIQDFLVMRQHITVDEDNDESSSAGDYNQGLAIDPCAYLSDSEVSTGSVDLSAEQVVWEKRLVDCPTPVAKDRLRRTDYKKSNSSHEVRRGRRAGRPLRRRASDNLLHQSAGSSPMARRTADSAGWNRRTDTVPPNESVELEIGEDCGSGSSLDSQTAGRPSHLQFGTLPPVVSDWDRPVQCSGAAEEHCHSAHPCLTHALLLAGLPGGGRTVGRRHLSTAHSAHRLPTGQCARPPLAPPAGAGSRSCSGDEQRPPRHHSYTSHASVSSVSQTDVLGLPTDAIDTLADVVDEPPQMTALERKLIMKKHPMLRNDTNAHILAPPDFRIGMH